MTPEKIIKALEATASRYARLSNAGTVVEGMIYGEICDALRHLQDEIRKASEE